MQTSADTLCRTGFVKFGVFLGPTLLAVDYRLVAEWISTYRAAETASPAPSKPANTKPPDIASASVPDTLAALQVIRNGRARHSVRADGGQRTAGPTKKQPRRLNERRGFHLERQDAPSGLKMSHYRNWKWGANK